LELPPHSRLVMECAESALKLRHRWLEFERQHCSIWLLSTDASGGDPVRRLRMHLSRLHAELGCLRTVLLRLDEGNYFDLSLNRAASEALQRHLNRSIKQLKQPKRAGWNQCAMLTVARQAVTASLKGELASLRSFFRLQIARKIERYVKEASAAMSAMDNIPEKSMTGNFHAQNVTVGGDFNVTAGRSINSSFNRPAVPLGAEGLNTKLEALTELIVKLAARLPTHQSEQVTRDFDALKSEAISTHPRKTWCVFRARVTIDSART